jgi:uncharacterized protein (DUF952 family)
VHDEISASPGAGSWTYVTNCWFNRSRSQADARSICSPHVPDYGAVRPFLRATLIYKILRNAEWRDAQTCGAFSGSADDVRDGFIHFSTAAQLRGTLERHYAGESGLVVLEVPAPALGDALRWEPSRDGALFPHLYGVLPLTAVTRTIPLFSVPGRGHDLPPEFA